MDGIAQTQKTLQDIRSKKQALEVEIKQLQDDVAKTEEGLEQRTADAKAAADELATAKAEQLKVQNAAALLNKETAPLLKAGSRTVNERVKWLNNASGHQRTAISEANAFKQATLPPHPVYENRRPHHVRPLRPTATSLTATEYNPDELNRRFHAKVARSSLRTVKLFNDANLRAGWKHVNLTQEEDKDVDYSSAQQSSDAVDEARVVIVTAAEKPSRRGDRFELLVLKDLKRQREYVAFGGAAPGSHEDAIRGNLTQLPRDAVLQKFAEFTYTKKHNDHGIVTWGTATHTYYVCDLVDTPGMELNKPVKVVTNTVGVEEEVEDEEEEEEAKEEEGEKKEEEGDAAEEDVQPPAKKARKTKVVTSVKEVESKTELAAPSLVPLHLMAQTVEGAHLSLGGMEMRLVCAFLEDAMKLKYGKKLIPILEELASRKRKREEETTDDAVEKLAKTGAEPTKLRRKICIVENVDCAATDVLQFFGDNKGNVTQSNLFDTLTALDDPNLPLSKIGDMLYSIGLYSPDSYWSFRDGLVNHSRTSTTTIEGSTPYQTEVFPQH